MTDNPHKIVIPKRFRYTRGDDGPTFFLAGPVRGGGDWQKDFYEALKLHLQRFVVAIPYYHTYEEPFPLRNLAEPNSEVQITFPRQLDWERHYMLQAAKFGCLVFWFGEESKSNPRPDGKYGNDSLGEIGRWSVEQKYNPKFKIAVGITPNFYGRDQMERNWKHDNPQCSPICSTFEQTVALAHKLSLEHE